MSQESKPNRAPTGKVLSANTARSYCIPRRGDGSPVAWVIELARLRAAGWTSVKILAARVGRSPDRIYQVMADPDYGTLEIVECLKVLGLRRARALLALGDKAETGDVAAIRLVAELTGLVEPLRPMLIQIGKLTGVEVNVDATFQPLRDKSTQQLETERDEYFSKLFGGLPPVDVIFRNGNGGLNGGNESGMAVGNDDETDDAGGNGSSTEGT